MTKREIRDAFRTAVFERDGHLCKLCGRNDAPLDAHHITPRERMPAGGYVAENGITLCSRMISATGGPGRDCHYKAERAIDDLRGDYSPSALYALIESSYEKAHAASVELFTKQMRGR